MRTSINLQTQKTYYPVEEPTIDGTIEFKILQLLTDESISCDISSVTKIDTTEAQSVFLLFGGPLDPGGVVLNPGENYGGITINENMAGFVIDTNAIVIRVFTARHLCLTLLFSFDLTQSSVIFTVPAYHYLLLLLWILLEIVWTQMLPLLEIFAFVPYKS